MLCKLYILYISLYKQTNKKTKLRNWKCLMNAQVTNAKWNKWIRDLIVNKTYRYIYIYLYRQRRRANMVVVVDNKWTTWFINIYLYISECKIHTNDDNTYSS